jgi:hypothetical protein
LIKDQRRRARPRRPIRGDTGMSIFVIIVGPWFVLAVLDWLRVRGRKPI